MAFKVSPFGYFGSQKVSPFISFPSTATVAVGGGGSGNQTPPSSSLTNIRIGSTTPTSIYVGSTEVTEVYVGSTKVWG